jgi:hypothetical protein
MSYYHDSSRSIMDDIIQGPSQNFGMAQEMQSEDSDDHRNLFDTDGQVAHGEADAVVHTTHPVVATGTCAFDCDHEEKTIACETRVCPCMPRSLGDKTSTEGYEHPMHEGHTQDPRDTQKTQDENKGTMTLVHADEVMAQIDEALLYINNTIERNTITITIFGVTTMVGFTILSGLLMLTWNIIASSH